MLMGAVDKSIWTNEEPEPEDFPRVKLDMPFIPPRVDSIMNELA